MQQVIHQNCPLCNSDAEYYTVDYGERKYFNCSHCTRFQISRRAEQVLDQAPQQWRDDHAAKAASTLETCIWVITVPSQSSALGASTPSLSGEVISKSELLL